MNLFAFTMDWVKDKGGRDQRAVNKRMGKRYLFVLNFKCDSDSLRGFEMESLLSP